MSIHVRTLDAAEATRRIDALVDILRDAVDGGASVSFLPPMDPALEEEARRTGRTLITMDTRKGDNAEPLYVSLGYMIAGVIPRYALSGEGTRDDTAILYKEL